MRDRNRWLIVVIFAIAMAWMESSTVAYLRALVGRIVPYQTNPLPRHEAFGVTELVREVATMLMLASVGWLAGRNWRTRVSYALIAFGVWDIFYYVFLAVIVGWPKSLFDWDVLFLIPLPWWGPVLAPVLIAALMVVGGTLVTQCGPADRCYWPTRWALALNAAGIALALVVFMADTARAVGGGEEALRRTLPVTFNWPLFLVALALMSAVLVDLARQIWFRGSGDGLAAAKAAT